MFVISDYVVIDSARSRWVAVWKAATRRSFAASSQCRYWAMLPRTKPIIKSLRMWGSSKRTEFLSPLQVAVNIFIYAFISRLISFKLNIWTFFVALHSACMRPTSRLCLLRGTFQATTSFIRLTADLGSFLDHGHEYNRNPAGYEWRGGLVSMDNSWAWVHFISFFFSFRSFDKAKSTTSSKDLNVLLVSLMTSSVWRLDQTLYLQVH